MGKNIKFKHQDREIEAELLDYETIDEGWNKYRTEDGTVIKIKIVVSKIIRTNEFTQTGEPIYVVNSTNVIDAEVPEILKEGKKDKKENVQ